MNNIKSRVSYLQGLIDGLNVESESKEGKVLVQIASILGDMAEEIENLTYAQEETEEYVDAIDEDLGSLEDDFYYEDEDYEDEEFEDDCENYISLNCPNCDETVYIDSDICSYNEDITCPNCHSKIALDCCCGHEDMND